MTQTGGEVGMIDREKVIKGLEECLSASCRGFKPGIYCPMSDEVWGIVRDALALLKAQEARVMTLVEAHGADICWYEQAGEESIIPATFMVYYLSVWGNQTVIETLGREDRTIRYDNEYGETWRCWTSKPTDEQREAVPWE